MDNSSQLPHLEDKQKVFAFAIDNTHINVAGVARVLAAVEGGSEIKRPRLFRDIHITFMYFGIPYSVLEPWGDNDEYWIGPVDNMGECRQDISELENALKRYKAPWYKRLLGA